MRAAAVVLMLLLTANGCPAKPAPKPTTQCHEGDSCWDCKTDGNKRCGPSDRKRLSPEVGDRSSKPRDVVAKGSEPGVARKAQQPPHRTSGVVVVDVKIFIPTWIVCTADCTSPALGSDQGLVRGHGQAVLVGQSVRSVPGCGAGSAPGDSFAGPVGSSPELVDRLDGVATPAQLLDQVFATAADPTAACARVTHSSTLSARALGSRSHAGTVTASTPRLVQA